jgi:hypothetical protein
MGNRGKLTTTYGANKGRSSDPALLSKREQEWLRQLPMETFFLPGYDSYQVVKVRRHDWRQQRL